MRRPYLGAMGANWVGGTFNINEGLGHRITNAVGNGIVGGGISAATGGDFGEGFIASAFAAAFKPLTFKIGEGDTGISARINRTAFAAMIGGTASALGGGKFANGAASAAFTHWHNGENHAKAYWDKMKAVAKNALNTAKEFVSDRLSATVGGRFAYGPGVEGNLNFNANGVTGSGGYAVGLGAHTRSTVDFLVYDGGDTTGFNVKASGCMGSGFGGCLSVVFNPENQNLKVRASFGAVSGASFGVRPGYSERIHEFN